MNEDILTHGETMSEERLLEGLRKTPELKRRLVMRVAALAALPGRSVYFHRSQVMAACSPRLTE